jgi:hypothetical protein
MRNAMGTIGKAGFFLFVLVAPVLAQNRLQTEPSPAVTGPAYDVSVGYTNLAMPIPGAGRVNLNGFDISGNVDLNPRWGATVDSNYARTSSLLGIPHGGYVLSFLGGPVFYPVAHGNTRMFVHVLAGVGMVDGAVPESDINYRYGWLGQFSYAAGGGIEHSVAGPFAVRISGDYLHTAFYNSAGAVQPQNNFRVTASFVLRLKQPQHRGHPGR